MDLIFPLLILFMIGLVFMSSRQRKKQEAKQKSLQDSLNVGDVVVMTSGVSGTIVDVDDERTVDVEIAPDVITTWLRAAVREKLVAEDDTAGAGEVDGSHEALDAPEETRPETRPESSVPTEQTPVVDASSNGSSDSSSSDITSDAKSDIKADSSDGLGTPRSN